MNDFIPKDAAIQATDGELTITGEENMAAVAEYITGVVERLKAIPGRPKGKWIWDEFVGAYRCTECDRYAFGCTGEVIDGSFKFCPYCGTEMERTDE